MWRRRSGAYVEHCFYDTPDPAVERFERAQSNEMTQNPSSSASLTHRKAHTITHSPARIVQACESFQPSPTRNTIN